MNGTSADQDHYPQIQYSHPPRNQIDGRTTEDTAGPLGATTILTAHHVGGSQ